MSALTTAQWELLEPFFPSRDLLQGRPGRPRHHARPVLEGIFCGFCVVALNGKHYPLSFLLIKHAIDAFRNGKK